MNPSRCLPAAALALFLTACASVPFDRPKTFSTALSGSGQTTLGRRVAALDPAPGNGSGFYLLTDGIDALAARLSLIRAAELGLDVQYYFILESLSGRLFLSELLAAADRGVRVRLLLDDWSTDGYEGWMAALEAHPRIEIRLFNPFSRRKARAFSLVTDLGRVEHRMHNKSLTADAKVTIVGGRNIGDEYFGARQDVDFVDLDLLGFGPVAMAAAEAFDVYWNSWAAVPVSVLLENTVDPEILPRIRDRHREVIRDGSAAAYGKALASTLIEGLESGELPLEWAPSELIQDSPEKVRRQAEGQEIELLAPRLGEVVYRAHTELLLISPYFVPLDSGVDRLRELVEQGTRVVVVTNSLAATDVAIVHAGYKKFRKQLLEAGVELWETRADLGAEAEPVSHTRTSLHTKAFVVDRRLLFVGSFNWDPRSVVFNTEMGIMVSSEALAEQMVESTLSGLPEAAYRLRLDDRGRIEWVGFKDGREEIRRREPQAGFWRRLVAAFFGILPIAGQL